MKQYFYHLQPMAPLETGEKFRKTLDDREFQQIKAVVFDVYGTMLISSAGDVNEFKHGKENVVATFEKTGLDCNGRILDLEFGEMVIQELLGTIQQVHQREMAGGISSPEVIIEKVWEEVLDRLLERRLIPKGVKNDVRTLALVFEFLSNPCWPMPGLRQVLEKLDKSNYTLGITSNAQFYTPMLLKYFLEEKDFLSEKGIPFFKDDHVLLSYREGWAKPGMPIFKSMRDVLAKEDILPSQALFVGNDMLNDVYPAVKAGFRTVLFAGDKRSLRLRKYMPEAWDPGPDAVITDLRQILELLKIKGE
jgi:putative hydrolase of the HAD superfamily